MVLNDSNKWVWVAGLCEGEGCFNLNKDKRSSFISCKVVVEMTDEDVIQTLHKYFGGKLWGPYQYGPKTSWRWCIQTKNDLYWFLIKIKPYMHARRLSKIVEILDHLDSMGYPKDE